MQGRALQTGLALLLAAVPCALAASPVAAQTPPGETAGRDLRIVELRLRDRSSLARDLFAWQDGDALFLPLDVVFPTLGFPIAVDSSGVADGWFLREKQAFRLDSASGSVLVAGRSYELAGGDYAVIEGAPHVSLGALNRWFSLGARFAADRQVVVFDPPYLLAEEEALRRSGGARLARNGAAALDTSGFVAVEPDWRLLGWPHVTANLSAAYDEAIGDRFAGTAQFLATGDLMFMTGRLAVSYSTLGFSDARLTLDRRDADGGLLGPLQASYIELGDVASGSLPLIARNGAGRGIRLGREPITRADSFDTTDIIGDATPGWQAELFRDGELLGFQEIGTDGRYVFPAVPLRFGSNRFRIQLYGPAGERESVDKVFDIADTLIQPGTLRYSATLYDASRSLLGSRTVDEFSLDGNGEPLDQGIYGELSAGYGLSGALSLTAFAALRESTDRPTRSWYGAGTGVRFGNMLLAGNLALQDDGATAWDASVLAGVGPLSLSLAREQFGRDFDSEESRLGTASGVRSRTEASADLRLAAIGIALDVAEVRQFGGARDRSAQVRISGVVAGISATHRLAWRSLETPGALRTTRLDGGLALSGAVGRLRLRGAAEYDVQPRWLLRRLRSEATYRLDDWYLQAGFDRNLEDKSSQWRLGANRDWNGIRLGVEGRYDDRRGDARALVTLAFALDRGPAGQLRFGRDARSDRGQLGIAGFHDIDGDGLRSAGEPDVALQFISDPRGRSVSGSGMIDDLPADRRVSVAPDLASNPDPFLVPAHPGYRVMLRPGSVQRIDVPVVDSGDAEIILRDANGQLVDGAVVELKPCQGGPSAFARTAHDGLAYFRQLLPGCYRIAQPAGYSAEMLLAPKDVARLEVMADAAGAVSGAEH